MEQTSSKAPVIRGSEAVRYGYEKVYSSVLQLDPSLSFLIDYVRETRPPKRGEFQHLLPKARAGDTAPVPASVSSTPRRSTVSGFPQKQHTFATF